MAMRQVSAREYGSAEKRGRRRTDPELLEAIQKAGGGERFFYEAEEGEQEKTAKARIKRVARDLKLDLIVESLQVDGKDVLGVRPRTKEDPAKREMPAAARAARGKGKGKK